MPTAAKAITLLAACLSLGACTTTSLTSGVTAPTTKDTIIAQMNGGLIGGDLGKKLPERERRKALEAEYRALEYTPARTPVTWKADNGRMGGEVVAAQPYRVGSQDCRQYSHKLSDGVRESEARGTACRNPDGSWTPLT